MGLTNHIWWDSGDYTYNGTVKVGSQTIHIQFDEVDWSDTTSHFNIVLTIYSKRKHIEQLHGAKTISGKNPMANVIAGLKLFDELEAEVIERFSYKNLILHCGWLDNRRRDAYWKVLSRRGYQWGYIDGQKVIMKKVRKSEDEG